MAEIKAIETMYNGYRFRSRIEARWAVFFDAIDFEYEYEPEGFDLGDGYYYLPDFYLPENNSWVEIKGRGITDFDYEKIIRFCTKMCDFTKFQSKFRVLGGQIPFNLYYEEGNPPGILCYDYISPAEYEYCKKNDEKHIDRGILAQGIWIPNRKEEEVLAGLRKARQARFEFGECG